MTEDHVSNVTSDLLEFSRRMISHHVTDRVYLPTTFHLYTALTEPLDIVHDAVWSHYYPDM